MSLAPALPFRTPENLNEQRYELARARQLARAWVDFVHARRGVFEDVLQETLLAAYRRGAKPGRAQVHYVEVANERDARVIRNGTIGLPSPSSQPWLAPRSPEHSRLILVQRTTAKEQARRLIAAELSAEFIAQHGGVVVENHLNMVRPTLRPAVSPATVAAVLNSQVVDQLFRCTNGSVAVSAFELEAIPLPSPQAMRGVERLVARGACSAEIKDELARLYGQTAA